MVEGRRTGALKRLAIAIVYVPVSFFIIIPIALFFGLLHAIIQMLGLILGRDGKLFPNPFFKWYFRIWTRNADNLGALLGFRYGSFSLDFTKGGRA